MSKKRIRVGVIFGGRTGEHEVSLASARSVLHALDRKKYDVVPIGITKQGKWISGPISLKLLAESSQKRIARNPETIMIPNPQTRSLVSPYQKGLRDGRTLDVIFPILHGPLGEDGTIQGLFELADMPYVGSGVLGSAVSMDKDIMKRLFLVAGLPVGQYISFTVDEWRKNASRISLSVRRLEYPVFVKPANLGSSVGISKVHSAQQLRHAVRKALTFDTKVVVEKSIENARDVECAILGTTPLRASVLGEIISSNEFYDYDAKYVDGKSQAVIPAKLSRAMTSAIRKCALKAFQAVEAAGMARVDFLVQGNRFFINEINTIPGFTEISMYPKLWEASGVPYAKLLDTLIELALKRHSARRTMKRSYTPKRPWHRKGTP